MKHILTFKQNKTFRELFQIEQLSILSSFEKQLLYQNSHVLFTDKRFSFLRHAFSSYRIQTNTKYTGPVPSKSTVSINTIQVSKESKLSIRFQTKGIKCKTGEEFLFLLQDSSGNSYFPKRETSVFLQKAEAYTTILPPGLYILCIIPTKRAVLNATYQMSFGLTPIETKQSVIDSKKLSVFQMGVDTVEVYLIDTNTILQLLQKESGMFHPPCKLYLRFIVDFSVPQPSMKTFAHKEDFCQEIHLSLSEVDKAVLESFAREYLSIPL